MVTRRAALDAQRRRVRRVAALICVLAASGVAALWWVFVTTTAGQRVEQVALDGSQIGRWRLADGARAVLDVVSVSFLALVIVVGVAVALARGQHLLAVAVPFMVGGANVTTQLLKDQILSRPDLGVSDALVNSLPSGHTTVAGTAAALAVFVAPPAWRWAIALAGAVYAGGTGLATLVNGWHRASDVVAALLVVLMWAALTVVLLGPPHAHAGDRAARATRRLLLLTAAGTGLLAVAALAVTWTSAPATSHRGTLLVAYGGAGLAVVAATCLVAGLLLHLCTAPRTAARPASRAARGAGSSTR